MTWWQGRDPVVVFEGETQDLYDKLQDLYDKLDGDGRVDSDGSRNPEKENDLT